jgi:hypothetical protein
MICTTMIGSLRNCILHCGPVARRGRHRTPSGVGCSSSLHRRQMQPIGVGHNVGTRLPGQEFPGSAGCSWPAPPAGFGISRVPGSADSSVRAANRHRVAGHPAKQNRVAPRDFPRRPILISGPSAGAPLIRQGRTGLVCACRTWRPRPPLSTSAGEPTPRMPETDR